MYAITKCLNEGCPIKESCSRHKQDPIASNQTYANFQLISLDPPDCEYFITWRSIDG